MTSAAPVPTNVSSSNTDSAGSQSAATSTSNPPATFAGKSASIASSNTTTPSTAGGAQNAPHPSVNSRASNMAAPTIVNNNLPNGDHAKRPSVTISAAGASGHLPNGPQSATRPNINFGSMNASGSPAMSNSVPFQNQTSPLPTQQNPRILSPAASPSPIPPPAASGGRPPSGLQPHANGLVFGGMGGENLPNGVPPMRRQSSQASHPDVGTPTMQYGQPRMNYMPGSGRGSRGPGFNQNFAQQPPFSPSQNFRPMNNGRPGGNMQPHFQGQNPMYNQNQARTPGPHGSQPGTPQMQHMQMGPSGPYLQPGYNAYQQQMQGYNNQFGHQPAYDPNYGYYQAQYQMHPQYLQQQMQPGPPQSPRFKPGAPAYSPGAYQTQPGQMSRSPSQNPEQHRPASVAPAQQPSPAAMQTPTQPPQSASKPASANFEIPQRKSKGIVIKNADGEVVTFTPPAKTTPAAPATAASPAPMAPTPPPVRAPSAAPTPAAEAKPSKTAEEIRAEFLANVQKDLKKDEKPATEDKAGDDEAAKAKAESEAKAAREKEEAEAKEAEAKAAKDKEEADAKAAAEAQAAKDKEEAEKKAEAEKAEAEKAAPAESSAEDAEAEKKRLEDEEMERMIAEMEAAEREEEEREKAFAEKRAKEKAEREAAEKASADKADEEMKRLEREAEALEEAREKKRQEGGDQAEESAEAKAEKEALFASLSKPSLGPGADATPSTPSIAEEPVAEEAATSETTSKSKPAGLKLETAKSAEPATPTAGMQSLRNARMLDLTKETVSYPEGTKGPEASASQTGKRAGRQYTIDFLLQFKPAYKEKPLLDWEQRVKDTMGTDDAKSARTPGPGGRAPSHRGPSSAFQAMGTFGAQPARTLPSGTTSQERFAASMGRGGPTMSNPLAGFAGRPGGFPMGGMPTPGRPMGAASQPGRGAPPQKSGRTNTRQRTNPKEEAKANAAMPLTAGMKLDALETSSTGWKPTSIGNKSMPVMPDGHMAPDMVQRKVKAALNKMTPERFDKIADQILEISAQSKSETDGRTLRQVIQLTFDKACDEAHWASMYAKFCLRMLEQMSPEIKDDNIVNKEGQLVTGGALFRKYLLNRCQEEFERGWSIDLPEKKEGETEEAAMMSDEYYIAAAAKRKGLGLIQFIGELFKLRMLSVKIMHQCFTRLLEFQGMPDESTVESLVKLLRTVGAAMQESDQPGPQLLDQYFGRVNQIMSMPDLPSRMHFMLLDTVDLRKAGWRSKDDAKGPKTIQEIREEAVLAQEAAERERLAQKSNRPPAGRGDARFPAPQDFPTNRVAADDLRRLGGGGRRQASQAGGPARTLGPGSFATAGSRSNSGRPGLGPNASLLSESRSSSKRQEEKKEDTPSKSAANAFDALASLDTEGGESPTASPTLTKAQPATESSSTSKPDASSAIEGTAQEATGDADAAPADVAQANE